MEKIFEEARKLVEPYGAQYPLPWEYIYINFFKDRRNLFFIDIGAYNGLHGSNTFLFEKYLDWSGICIEPNTNSFNELSVNRNCKSYNICIGNENTFKEFWEVEGEAAALSGLVETLHTKHKKRIDSQNITKKQIEVRTLASILEENKISNINYLSIDVECAEMQVLEGIDFTKCDIEIISVEDNGYSDNTNIVNHLTSNGYSYIDKVCIDMIFQKNKNKM